MMLKKLFKICLSADLGERCLPALSSFVVAESCLCKQHNMMYMHTRQNRKRHAISLYTSKPTCQQSSRHCESGERHARVVVVIVVVVVVVAAAVAAVEAAVEAMVGGLVVVT